MTKAICAALILVLGVSVPTAAGAAGRAWRAAIGQSHYAWFDRTMPHPRCEIFSGQSKRIDDPCKQIYLQCGHRWRVKLCGAMIGPVF
jgi:hypothetical protein